MTINWPKAFKRTEWPSNSVDYMSEELFNLALFPLREQSGVPMWPSKLFDAHVRYTGTSQHSTNGGARKSTATDMHVKTKAELAKVFTHAMRIPAIGGIGLYFDTNVPMFHIDTREKFAAWLRVDGEYIYLNADPVRFYKTLGEYL